MMVVWVLWYRRRRMEEIFPPTRCKKIDSKGNSEDPAMKLPSKRHFDPQLGPHVISIYCMYVTLTSLASLITIKNITASTLPEVE